MVSSELGLTFVRRVPYAAEERIGFSAFHHVKAQGVSERFRNSQQDNLASTEELKRRCRLCAGAFATGTHTYSLPLLTFHGHPSIVQH